MEEERKVRVAITKSDDYDDQQKKHDLEHFLTPKQKKRPTFQKIELTKWLKPILFAIVLGLVFGAGLMYFFSDYTADDPTGSEGQPVSNVTNDDEANDFLVKNWQLPAFKMQVSENDQSWLEAGEALIDNFSKGDFQQWVQEMPGRFESNPYAARLTQLINESGDRFMDEQTMPLRLAFFLAELS